MDLRYPPEAEQLREGLRSRLADVLPEGWAGRGALDSAARRAFDETWRRHLVEERLLAPAWPVEFGGRGLSILQQAVVLEEFAAAGVPALPHPNDPYGVNLLGPTVLHWGTDEQKSRYLPATIQGGMRWAQGYSEPEAGSDLFALRTRATQDHGRWVLNGRKIWQSAALTANWIFVLARTGEPGSRGKGLTFFLVPIDQPGVQVTGIKNMVGDVDFAEVAFDNAVVDELGVLGGVGQGAQVALSVLGFERGVGGTAAAIELRTELNRLIALTREIGRGDDPAVCSRIVDFASTIESIRSLALKGLAAAHLGQPPGAESSLIKLLRSTFRQDLTQFAHELLGADGLVLGEVDPASTLNPQPLGTPASWAEAWTRDFLYSRPATIYGGTSQIQRDTIAERLLGLPREPRVSS